MAIGPSIDHLVGNDRKRRHDGDQQQGRNALGTVEVLPDFARGSKGRLDPGDTRMAG
jgi:hypothetical protein